MHMLRLSPSLLVVAVALAAGGCSSTPAVATAPPPAPTASGPYTVDSSHITLQGAITAIDKPSRTISVRGSKGAEMDFVASDEVRNFDQLKVGDTIALDYDESVAIELQPAGSAQVGVTTQQGGTVAPAGAKPGGSMSDTISVVTEVVAVDPVGNTIALKGPRGNTQKIAVERDDLRAKLPGVKKGDLLKISYTEAVAVAIRPVNP